jgi:hypothetical protein
VPDPASALARAFGEASGDPVHVREPARASDDDVALCYAEAVPISPIRLLQAAYDGCQAGLAALAEPQGPTPRRGRTPGGLDRAGSAR